MCSVRWLHLKAMPGVTEAPLVFFQSGWQCAVCKQGAASATLAIDGTGDYCSKWGWYCCESCAREAAK